MNKNLSIISASVAGRGHLESIKPIPCQDANKWKKLNSNWSIAITSDGAGSYKNSHIGSLFVVNDLIKVFEAEVSNLQWFINQVTPDEIEWRQTAIFCLKETRDNLYKYAMLNGLDFKTLGCTVNLALFSNQTILSAHIGDGRACYKDAAGEWKSLITPFKGEEAGSTVFITTDWCWECLDESIESRVINTEVIAVVLLSDGMESYSFTCYVKDENDNFTDPNKPFEPFLNANVNAILSMRENGISEKIASSKWKEYLRNNKNLINEMDDKTMLIGVFH